MFIINRTLILNRARAAVLREWDNPKRADLRNKARAVSWRIKLYSEA